MIAETAGSLQFVKVIDMAKMWWLFWRIFVTCQILNFAKTDRLPPAKFLHEFAIEHNLIAINILFPRSVRSHKIEWFKIVR